MSTEYFEQLAKEQASQSASAEPLPQEAPQAQEEGTPIEQEVVEGEMTQEQLDALENDANFTQAQAQQEPKQQEPKQVAQEEKTEERDDVRALSNFLKNNPDKQIEDFLTIQRGSEGMDNESKLRTFLSEKEGLTDTEIDLKLLDLLSDEDDEDDLEFYEEGSKEWKEAKKSILERKVGLDAMLGKADSFFEEKKQAFTQGKTTASSQADANDDQQAPALDIEANQKEYLKAIYQASEGVSDLTVKVGDHVLSVKADSEMKQSFRRLAEDVSSNLKPYFSEDFQKVNDADGFMKNYVAWNDPRVREAFLNEAIQRGISIGKEQQIKERRNINFGQGSNSPAVVEGSRDEVLNKLYEMNRVKR